MVRNVRMTGKRNEELNPTPQMIEGIQTFMGSSDKTSEALQTFQRIQNNRYIDRLKDVYSAADEVMTCDCSERKLGGVNVACGADSDCINRLTKIECVDGECSCGAHCQNQRFQRNQMANISIIATEHKGYGMRANCDIPPHTFIIEYKGEVIDEQEYKIRKEKYADEGIKHFYFMMIQEGQIIDATKRGSLGRFINHSCDPNAYVEKWVVDKRYRMGIFSKRKIHKGEEVTFNYNVDRYGAEPQKCYCGAKNCVGYLGGKTQTEVLRILPYAAREALGIKAIDEKRWIKVEKKMGIKISKDNIEGKIGDFVISLQLEPLDMDDVAKVASCLLLPNNNVIIIDRVLERFDPEDPGYPELLSRLNRLHGLQAMASALKAILSTVSNGEKLKESEEKALKKIVRILSNWPRLSSKNTIKGCNLEGLLSQAMDRVEDNRTKQLIAHILEAWKDLPVVYRIPKKSATGKSSDFSAQLGMRRTRNQPNNSSGSEHVVAKQQVTKLKLEPETQTIPEQIIDVDSLPESRKINGKPLPSGWEWTMDPKTNAPYYYNREKNLTQWEFPTWNETTPAQPVVEEPQVRSEEDEERLRAERELKVKRQRQKRFNDLKKKRRQEQEAIARQEEQKLEKLSSIIKQASTESEEFSVSKNSSAKNNGKQHDGLKPHISHSSKQPQEHHHHHHHQHHAHDPVEVQWLDLFASIVPNMLKKYEHHIGKENLKNCAREITHVLAHKEMKRHNGEPVKKKVSEARKQKTWSFVKSYMTKFLSKYDAKRSRRHSLASSSEPDPKKQHV